jgi:hypothetical protein
MDQLLAQIAANQAKGWCEGRDLNPHGVTETVRYERASKQRPTNVQEAVAELAFLRPRFPTQRRPGLCDGASVHWRGHRTLWFRGAASAGCRDLVRLAAMARRCGYAVEAARSLVDIAFGAGDTLAFSPIRPCCSAGPLSHALRSTVTVRQPWVGVSLSSPGQSSRQVSDESAVRRHDLGRAAAPPK